MPKRTWTDDDLRAAVTSSKTNVEVLAKLGLTPRGRNYTRGQKRIVELGIDRSHLRRASRVAQDDDLRRVVPSSTSYEMVSERLGVAPSDIPRLKRRIGILGISTFHFIRARPVVKRRTRWSDDDLRAAVSASTSFAATLRGLGLVPAGGNYVQVQRRIKELALDTSHFTGQGWNTGLFRPQPALPLDQLLVRGRWTTSHNLKQRLIRAGVKEAKCELCGWAERAADGRIPVEIDHVNGDKTDNRLENLRILCPNCHALQPTHRGLNQKRRKR